MTDEYAPLVSPKTRDARPARRCVTCCVVATLALVALAHAPAMTARETALMLKYLAGSHEGSAWASPRTTSC